MPRRRLALYALAFLSMISAVSAADDVPKQAAPTSGTCFKYALSDETGVERDPAAAHVSRVDVQPLQFKVENKPLPETRLRIGMLLKNQNGPIPNDHSAPCTGEGLAFNCTMKCGDKVVGKFRAEALPTKPSEPKANYLRLIIEAPTVLNACTEGKEPLTLPNELINLQIILKGAEPSTCFN
jgi:hypothetical protein